jgi:hypothetical protein
MTSVAVIVPYRPSCKDRERAWELVGSHLASLFSATNLVIADHDGEPYSKALAVMTAAQQIDADIVVVHDADVITNHLPLVIAQLGKRWRWAIPHTTVARLSCEQTEDYYNGVMPELSASDEFHTGVMGGGVVAVFRDDLLRIPFDVRFKGWGGEDTSWGKAMRTLVGEPFRHTSTLIHLWHQPQQRINRAYGSEETLERMLKYCDAFRNPIQMQELVNDAREALSLS